MRLAHLTDIEIQEYCDSSNRSREARTVDWEITEHLNMCQACREQVDLYETLFSDITREPELTLPRNFAKKVTLSLPPFAAARSRNRRRLALVSAISTFVLTLTWLVLLLDIRGALASAVGTVAPTAVAVKSWMATMIPLIPWPSINVPRLELDWTIFRSVTDAFIADPFPALFVACAAVVLLLVGSLDNLVISEAWSKRVRQ
ncbi:MAG: hypothetical protein KKA42_00605 [candidate division Zixibacteria bacterium]|nr:hypothetical protein [candidate division Zixibacteria bacterium]